MSTEHTCEHSILSSLVISSLRMIEGLSEPRMIEAKTQTIAEVQIETCLKLILFVQKYHWN